MWPIEMLKKEQCEFVSSQKNDACRYLGYDYNTTWLCYDRIIGAWFVYPWYGGYYDD